jgi:hypothetical protein
MNDDDDLTRPVETKKRPPEQPPRGRYEDELTRVAGAQSSGVPEGWDPMERPVVGWLVVVGGEGKGSALQLTYGQNSVGRGLDADVRLIFSPGPVHREDIIRDEGNGLQIFRNEQWSTSAIRFDPKVSRHQFNIIYEGRTGKKFYIDRSTDASSLTYIKTPGTETFVSGLVELKPYARILLGDTELMFVPLCRPQTDEDRGFDWQG